MYNFSSLVQAGIAAGQYIPVTTAAGVPIGMVRDAATGQFAAHAVGMSLNPLTAIPSMAMGAGQLYQGQKALQGIKALSASVATLQATTAVIGVGTVAAAALSAVNLWQTLKLRKDVQQMHVEVQEGFIDLKQVFADQEAELIEHIQQVSEDVAFKDHYTILSRAYCLFEKALDRLGSAMTMQNPNDRKDEIQAVRTMMFDALKDYDNPELMSGVNSIAYLRRRECVWAIEQAIALTYELQGEWQTVCDRLIGLNTTIRKDASITLDKTEGIEELDFLFPELTRIHDHDLAAIELWKNRVEWTQTLPEAEMKQLQAFANSKDEKINVIEGDLTDKPAEYAFYEEAKSNFVPEALYKSLIYSFDTEARRQEEQYITERAKLESLTAFSPQNLAQATPLAVANLALYFATRDDSSEEEEVEEVIAA